MANDITKTWKKAPTPVKLVIYGLAAFVVYRQGKRIYDKYQLNKRLKQYQQSEVPVLYTTGGAGSPAVTQQLNLSAIAQQIYTACWDYAYGTMEDEAGMINAIKQVPKPLIPQLAQVYNQLFQKDLQHDFVTYLSTDQYNQISYLFQ